MFTLNLMSLCIFTLASQVNQILMISVIIGAFIATAMIVGLIRIVDTMHER